GRDRRAAAFVAEDVAGGASARARTVAAVAVDAIRARAFLIRAAAAAVREIGHAHPGVARVAHNALGLGEARGRAVTDDAVTDEGRTSRVTRRSGGFGAARP